MILNVNPQLNQWDADRIVEVSDTDATHIHFANPGDSKAPIIEIVNGKAKIPNYLLQTGKPVIAYAVLDGVTIGSKTFPVRKRERPENYVYEDDQRNYIYELIAETNDAAKNARNAADRANEAADRMSGHIDDKDNPHSVDCEQIDAATREEMDVVQEHLLSLNDEFYSHRGNLDNPHGVTCEQIGAATMVLLTDVGSAVTEVGGVAYDNKAAIANHINNVDGDNPHGVTCEQIGAVPNEAFAKKVDELLNEQGLSGHPANYSNPHYVTAEQIGAVTQKKHDTDIAELRDLAGALRDWAEDEITPRVESVEHLISTHKQDDENPHGVTCAQIGAAPSGYGLGEKASLVDNWNAGYVNAFARSNSNSPDGKMWYGLVCRDAANAATTTEIAFSTEAGNSVCEVRRSRNAAGAWGAWEYVNPPMVEGVEYRTTKRINGSAVFEKLGTDGIVYFSTDDGKTWKTYADLFGVNAIPVSNSSSLVGKKIVYEGDSICYGAGYEGGYAKLIAKKTSGTYVNQGVGGGRLITAGTDGGFHSVVDNLPNLPTDGDLYCFEGGINDYWENSILGSFDYTNFYDELDTKTVCGALETIFRYCLDNFVGKPVCFVITHKIQGTAYTENSNGDSFKDYHDAMVGICEKYSVPFYDAFNESGLNGWNTVQSNAYLTGNSAGEPDGCHPNEEGYKRYYVPQLLRLFESIMPTDTTQEGESYTNLLEEAGYTQGVYLLNGNEASNENAFTTGYMPVGSNGTIYLKNVTMPDESGHGNQVALYDADKNYIGQVSVTSSLNDWQPVFDDGNLIQFIFYIDNAAYMRISTWGIDETSIISVNNPIV